MNDLIQIPKNDLANAYELLAEVRAENLWLANFISADTKDNYRRAVGSFIQQMGIETPEALYGVSQAHIIAYRDQLQESGYSANSIAQHLSALSSLYKFLSDRQLCQVNPVSGVRRPPTGHNGLGSGKTPALSKKDVRAMLDAPDTSTLKGLRDSALLHVYFYTGGRRAEPTRLKVKHLRMDADYWVLEMTVKGEKTNTVAIHTECQSALRCYLEAAGHLNEPNAWLFQSMRPDRTGPKPISRTQFGRLFKDYAIKAGLPASIATHSARATLITEGYKAGLAGEDIQRTVAHSSITTTEAYNRTSKRHRQSASFAMSY